jgi:hypothetical protein
VYRFWDWYNRHYALNITVAAGLFALQIVHLVWLTFDPLWFKLFGEALFELDKPWSWPLLLVDYTEVPVLVSVSLVYLNELRAGFGWKPVVYLAFLNSQWLHIFWITDEFVVASNDGQASVGLPLWLAYIAIAIDYLELPVIYDTLRRMGAEWRNGRLRRFLEEDLAVGPEG